MTVKELKEKLEVFDENMLIILSRDEEGNGFKNIYSVDEYFAMQEGYGWEVVADEDVGEEYDEENLVKVVCLWP